MSRLRKISIFFGAFFLIGGLLMAITFRHWWWKTMWSRVFVNGEYSEQASVLRNADGDFLIIANGQDHGAAYIYYSSSKDIGVPDITEFIFLGLCAYSKDLPVPAVMSSNRIKIETDMYIVEQNEWVEFTGMDGERIKVFRSNL